MRTYRWLHGPAMTTVEQLQEEIDDLVYLLDRPPSYHHDPQRRAEYRAQLKRDLDDAQAALDLAQKAAAA